jgi:hypothetical protein
MQHWGAMFRFRRILLMVGAAAALHGQITQLDLHFQSRDVDFSTANSTAPFKSGTSLPSICSVGQMFFMLNAPAGSNLYGCTSLNGWTLESTSGGGGSGASMASQLGDFAVLSSSGTVLTMGANCSASTPCNVRFGALVYSFTSGGSVSISAGTGLAYIYMSSAGALTVGHNLTANCTAGCVAQSGITAVLRGTRGICKLHKPKPMCTVVYHVDLWKTQGYVSDMVHGWYTAGICPRCGVERRSNESIGTSQTLKSCLPSKG